MITTRGTGQRRVTIRSALSPPLDDKFDIFGRDEDNFRFVQERNQE